MELARRVSRAAGEETPWDREEVRLVPTDSEARRTLVGWGAHQVCTAEEPVSSNIFSFTRDLFTLSENAKIILLLT